MRRRTVLTASATAVGASVLGLAAPTAARVQSTTVVISEVQSRAPNANPNIANAVELYNLTSSSFDLSGWEVNFYDSSNIVTATFLFPVGTDLPANGFVIVKDPNFQPVWRCRPVSMFNYALVGGATDGLPDRGGVEVVDASGTQIDGVAMSLGASTPLEGNPATPLTSATDQFGATIQRDILGTDTDNNAVDFSRRPDSWGCLA